MSFYGGDTGRLARVMPPHVSCMGDAPGGELAGPKANPLDTVADDTTRTGDGNALGGGRVQEGGQEESLS